MCRSEVSVCPPGGWDLRWCQEKDWRLCQWGDISKPASMLWCDIVTRRGLEAVSTRRNPQSASMWWCLWCFINVYSQSRIVTRRGLEAEAVSTKNMMMFYICNHFLIILYSGMNCAVTDNLILSIHQYYQIMTLANPSTKQNTRPLHSLNSRTLPVDNSQPIRGQYSGRVITPPVDNSPDN